MATQMIRQTSFTSGEVDPINFRRTDLESYMTAAQSLQNIEINTTGAARKRKGTLTVQNFSNVANDPNAQGFEFIDQGGNYYAVILTNFLMTIYSVNAITKGWTQVSQFATPYPSAILRNINSALDNASLVFVHPSFTPYRLYFAGSFIFAPIIFSILPSYDFGIVPYGQFSVTMNVVSGVFLISLITSVNPGFNGNWIGGQIVFPGPNFTLGYGLITAVAFTGSAVAFAGIVLAAYDTSYPGIFGYQYQIKQPLINAVTGYPSTVLFYQNRLWFGNLPLANNMIIGSQLNKPTNYDVGTAQDTDAIVYTIGQTDSGPIISLNGGKQLEIFTTNYEFACPQTEAAALTPSTFAIRQQSSYGSSQSVNAITYVNDTYYVAKEGNAIINFHFDGIGLTYTSKNVSQQSQHLVKNPINRAILKSDELAQDNFIYYLNPDNTVTAFQFSKEVGIAALTPITFPLGIVIIDIFTVMNEVYLIKTNFAPGLPNTNDWIDGLNNDFTDSGGSDFVFTPMGGIPVSVTIDKFYPNTQSIFMDNMVNANVSSGGVITGLTTLAGQTVEAVVGGQDLGSAVVTANGTATFDNPYGYTGLAMVGILYPVQIIPMYYYAGPTASPYYKRVSRIYVEYYNSLNFKIGGQLVPYQQISDVQLQIPPQPQSGLAVFNPVQGWARDSTFSITQLSPFDLQIVSIAYQVGSAIL